jgi:hypothetical protein
MRISILLFAELLLLLANSCIKDELTSDYAGKITGIYEGTLLIGTTGTLSSSCILNKSSETIVDLKLIIGPDNISINGIEVTRLGKNSFKLYHYDSSGAFEGEVDGYTLSWKLTSGSGISSMEFYGTAN